MLSIVIYKSKKKRNVVQHIVTPRNQMFLTKLFSVSEIRGKKLINCFPPREKRKKMLVIIISPSQNISYPV